MGAAKIGNWAKQCSGIAGLNNMNFLKLVVVCIGKSFSRKDAQICTFNPVCVLALLDLFQCYQLIFS